MTSTNGRHALEALNSVRAFYSEVCRLVLTADHWFGTTTTWRVRGTPVLRNQSGRVDAPHMWLPETVDRWYGTSDPHVATYLTVILQPRTEHRVRFDEPLITAGWVRSVRKTSYDDPKRWISYSAMWTDVPRDGVARPLKVEPSPDKFGVERHSFLVLPLFELRNSEDLVSRVLQPLVDDSPVSALAPKAQSESDEPEDEHPGEPAPNE